LQILQPSPPYHKQIPMKRRNFLLLSLTLAALGACSERPKLPVLPAGETVLAFGDSVTFGTGASRGEDWPSLLADRTGWQIINGGIPGDTAEAGKHRIESLLTEHQPRLVLIEIGGNDFIRRRPASAVKEDIRQIIRTTQAAGAHAVLIAVPAASLLSIVAQRPSDAPLYAELAKEEGTPLIPGVFSETLATPELRADPIHPNAAGYARMAEGIYRELGVIGLTR